MTLVQKLREMPHKYLFYIGLLVVVIFLFLSNWQFSRYKNELLNEASSSQTQVINYINVEEINLLNEETHINIVDELYLVNSWYLRSRVHNGQSGYHLVEVYKNEDNLYLIVNRGWIPLDKNIARTFIYEELSYTGILMDYDIKPNIGEADIPGSEYIFRIDKKFIENEMQISIQKYYLQLTETCGGGVQCINIDNQYAAPHLNYTIQWLVFAIVLTTVILRKNKLI